MNWRWTLCKVGVWVAAIGATWLVFAALIANDRLLPSPKDLFTNALPSFALFSGYSQPNLWIALRILGSNALDTLQRILVGLFSGGTVGFATGLLIQYFRKTRRANEILLAFARSVPLFALIPLFTFWFGDREIGIYIYISFAVFVIMATNVYEAVANVPRRYVLQARLLGASRLQAFISVHPHAIAPEMLAAVRNVAGWCWAFSLGAEYISATSGLGFLAYRSYLYSDMGKLFVLGAIYVMLGLAADRLLIITLGKTIRWHSGVIQ